MSKTNIGLILIALGVVVAVVSVAADTIGIGRYAGIDWVQILGVVIGLVVALIGVRLVLSKTVR